jgi:predicted secreted protein
MTQALFAQGTELRRNGTKVAEVVSISGPSISLDTEDVTSHDSTNGWEEMIATILRSGEVTCDINYVPTNSTHRNASGGLIYDMIQRATATWTIVLGATTIASFTGYVTAFEPSMPHDGKLAASVTIKPTGVVTLA